MDALTFITAFFAYWSLLCVLCFSVSWQRKALAAGIALAFLALLGFGFNILEPWQRLWLGTVGLLFTIKAAILFMRTKIEMLTFSKIGLLIYMSIWPGMDPQPFSQRVTCSEDGRRFVRGYLCFWSGLILLAASAFAPVAVDVKNWLCLISLLLMIHFGYADMLTCGLRIAGWNVVPLFDFPLASKTLSDFWSHRWNHAFVEMNKLLFLPMARRFLKPRFAIVAVFVISGLLHELGISYASGKLWGLPFIYFLIQGIGMLVERRWSKSKIDANTVAISRTFTLLWILLPLPLLFNNAFLSQFITPLSLAVERVEAGLTTHSLLSLGLWLAGIGHFCTLLAGLQVPFRLHWKEELSRLSNFNRKIMLNYAAYVGLIIIAFGWLTLSLHEQFLGGERCAVYLSVVIALFWILRLGVDSFYFRDADWPQGPEFVIGHSVLNTLFMALAFVYSWVVVINWPLS